MAIMSNRTKNAARGIAILVVLWFLIIFLLPRRAAQEQPAGSSGTATITPEPSRCESQGTTQETPSPIVPPTETPTPTAEPTPELLRSVTHLVQAGETLQIIADQYSTSVSLLAGYLTVDELSPGNEIIILAPNPAACPSQRIHLVVKNETLYSLAQRYEVSLETLMAENNLTDPMIGTGTTLCIPSR